MKHALLAVVSMLLLSLSTSTAPQSTCQGCDLYRSDGGSLSDASVTTFATNGGWVNVSANLVAGECFPQIFLDGLKCIGACTATITYAVGEMPGGLEVWECYSKDTGLDRTDCKMPPMHTDFDGNYASDPVHKEPKCNSVENEISIAVQGVMASLAFTCTACTE